jgi:hypothetical protein
MTERRKRVAGAAAVFVVWAVAVAILGAHGVSGKDARYLLSLDGPAPIPLMYLGAKHMVTGYDHLLFGLRLIYPCIYGAGIHNCKDDSPQDPG